MTLGEVEDVDVVANGGAVVGFVVVAEDEELLTLAGGDLGKEREQVVWNARGVFTHDAAGVAAGRVEVAQQTSIPLLHPRRVALFLCFGALRVDVVRDHQLRCKLGVAIWIGRPQGALFGDGNHARHSSCVAVDGRRGRVDDIGDIVARGRREEGQRPVDIDSVVVQRDLSRLAHCLQGGKVDDTVNVRVFGEDLVERLLVGNVDLVVFRLLSADKFYAIQNLGRRVVEVVDDDDLVVGFEERKGRKGANVASATRQCQFGSELLVSVSPTL